MYIHNEGAHSFIRFSVESLAPRWFRTTLYETLPIPSTAPMTGDTDTLSFWSLPLDLPTLSLDCEFIEGKKSFWQMLGFYILQHIGNTLFQRENSRLMSHLTCLPQIPLRWTCFHLPTGSVTEHNKAFFIRPLYEGHTGVLFPVSHGLLKNGSLASWNDRSIPSLDAGWQQSMF